MYNQAKPGLTTAKTDKTDKANEMVLENGSNYILDLRNNGEKAKAISEASRLHRQIYWVFTKSWLRKTHRYLKRH